MTWTTEQNEAVAEKLSRSPVKSDEACRTSDDNNNLPDIENVDGVGSDEEIPTENIKVESSLSGDFLERYETFSTIDIINTDAGLLQHSTITEPSFSEKNAEAKNPKDSKLAESLADDLSDILAFDEVALDWYFCNVGIWRPISKTRALKIINRKLHDVLPSGFSLSKLSGIEAFLKLYLAIDKWETRTGFLPMQNGVLNTATLELMDYSPAHRFRWQLPYKYDSKAKIDVIRHWLWNMTMRDIEAVNTIRAFMKTALLGGGVQKFLEVIGSGGTGKSTLVRLMVMLIGEPNHAATDLKNLEGNRFEAATLYGKRLAVISDSSRYGGDVSVLKAITGGDPIRHERKNQQQSESFIFGGVVVIASNEAIQSTDYTSGLARRRLPVVFNRKVSDEDKAKWAAKGGIEKAMQAELPGLLNWVLSMPDNEVNAALGGINGELTKAQRAHYCETNKLAAWLNDNAVIDDSSVVYIGVSTVKLKDVDDIAKEQTTKLYPNYELWCAENGVNPIAVQRFSNMILEVCEHVKLPIKRLNRDSSGARLQGLSIRLFNEKHLKITTPITREFLNSDGECRSSDEGNTQQSRASVDSADSVDKNLSVDMEVF